MRQVMVVDVELITIFVPVEWDRQVIVSLSQSIRVLVSMTSSVWVRSLVH